MTPAQLLLYKFGNQLTATQYRYVSERIAQAERGQSLTLSETARNANVSRQSIANWTRDPKFLWLSTQIVQATVHAGDVLVDRAVQVQAIGGRPSAVEANLRRRGLWNGGMEQSSDPAPTAAAAVSVTFVGLPPPPTPAEAAARNPPAGSNKVLDVSGQLV